MTPSTPKSLTQVSRKSAQVNSQAGSPSRGAVAPSSSGIKSGPANQFPHSNAASSRRSNSPAAYSPLSQGTPS
jgi:hypothetical protein